MRAGAAALAVKVTTCDADAKEEGGAGKPATALLLCAYAVVVR